MLISAAESCLLVVDVQERLAPAVDQQERVIARCAILIKGARRLGVPILASEHYPAGIGHLVPQLAAELPADAVFEKIEFACGRNAAFRSRLAALGRRQVVLCGMEAHVCVLQTGLALLAAGSDVFIVADAVGSRQPTDRDAALARLRDAGARLVTSEMVLFEWLERGDAPAFRELLALIK